MQRPRDDVHLRSRASATKAKIEKGEGKQSKLKDRCGVALFGNTTFRQDIARGTFSYLRQMRPSLLPWEAEDGIWSTNDQYDHDGSLFGDCMHIQNNVVDAVDS